MCLRLKIVISITMLVFGVVIVINMLMQSTTTYLRKQVGILQQQTTKHQR